MIDERLEESTLSDVASAYAERTATQSIGEGRTSFCGSILGPTTEAQAAACLRIWISRSWKKDKRAELQSAVYDALMNDNSNQSRFHIAPRHIFCASAGALAV